MTPYDMLVAADDTLQNIRIQRLPENELTGKCFEASLHHLAEMRNKMDFSMSKGKLGRWLGYIQGVAVANGWLTLDQCKRINSAHSMKKIERKDCDE